MLLTEFPYPSGDLHIGHWYTFAVSDILARYLRMNGEHDIMYPIGFDAFGLPAENAAIKHNTTPQEWTEKNIARMTQQLESMHASFDWDRIVDTSKPEYYRWTQWIFLKLYEQGLAYRAATKVNWCPKDKTVLANEQVTNGCCERCDTPVEQRTLEQWMFRTTAFADALIDDLEPLDWTETIKAAQRNWIGRSEGARIRFSDIEVFTTRADTLFGVTAVVMSPEMAKKRMDAGWDASSEVRAYIEEALGKRDLERMEEKEKTGVPAGFSVTNPASGQEVPVWIADYVLGSYGTGAVMMVPAHDERDYAFAQKYQIPIHTVIEPVTGTPKPDEEYRKSIVALVRNPKTGKILSLDWGVLGGTLLIGGGCEEDEDPVQCALREIREETGYSHVRPLGRSEVIHHHYRAHSKNVNRSIEAVGVHFELIDEAQDDLQQTADEQGKFTVRWMTEGELTQAITDPLHAYVLQKFTKGGAYTNDGILADSGMFSGFSSEEARKKIIEHLKEKGLGDFEKTYRLRDWVLSRQRYWGCPIPIINCPTCGRSPVPEKELPVKLPPLDDFKPADDGRSPLAKATEWLKVKCPQCGEDAERETDTMDTFVDSSWYFLRYADPNNKKKFADSKKLKEWLPVPMYIGGPEHNTMHLLYARFITKALHAGGHLDFDEPFVARRNHSVILGPDGNRMSKSRGNVVDPDKEVEKYGADVVRMYLAFMGPYSDQTMPWDPNGITGVARFVKRVRKFLEKETTQAGDVSVERALHAATKKIGEDIASMKYNTAVSVFMKLLNEIEDRQLTKNQRERLVLLLAPFAPQLTEELWPKVHQQKWPEYDAQLLVQETVQMPVQVNGKVRGIITIPPDAAEQDAVFAAKQDENIARHLADREPRKIIYLPGKLLNIVVE